MNRRNFLRTLAGGAAAAVAVRTFPFRVYSIPAEPNVYAGRLFWFGKERVDVMSTIDWGYDTDPEVWILNPEQAAAFEQLAHKVEIADVEALQLEDLHADLPDLFSSEHAFYTDSIAGIRYHEAPPAAGTYLGLKRSKYPGRLAPNQRGSFTVTAVDDKAKTITVSPAVPNRMLKKAELALGDGFKEEDLVFRGIRDRWNDFKHALKRA